jgi:hypothetical protein
MTMTRLAERELNTRYGRFIEILYYDGDCESIALVMVMFAARATFCVVFIPRASAVTSSTALNVNVPRRWLLLRN